MTPGRPQKRSFPVAILCARAGSPKEAVCVLRMLPRAKKSSPMPRRAKSSSPSALQVAKIIWAVEAGAGFRPAWPD